MKKAFLLLLVFATLPLAFAAGGGGGSPPPPPPSPPPSPSPSPSPSAGDIGGGNFFPYFSDVSCDDTGKIEFTMFPPQNIAARRLRDSQAINVTGTWIDDRFVSEEALFREAGDYDIVNEQGFRRQFTCPAFMFSCRLLELRAMSCVRNESGTYATVLIFNGTDTNLKYSFDIRQRAFGGPKIISYTRDTQSTELRGLQVINRNGPAFTVYVPQQVMADEFEVSSPACIGRYYRYSRVACGNGTGMAAPLLGQELKCGGYLNIADRVRCRIRLREEDKGEYENFFPEECMTREDKDACLRTYRAVQDCWQVPDGEGRIGCARDKLSLGDIPQGMASCAEKPAQEQGPCLAALRAKVYSLVKFRLYNLEEKAEGLLEEGLLEEDDLVAFVVAIERIKAAFNAATTKEQRKELVAQARTEWITLMRTVGA